MTRSLILSVIFLLLATDVAAAQGYGRVEEMETNAAYFFFTRPGEPTVQVSVWGTIPRPGIYEVRVGTDLNKLLTLAGGAPIQARDRNQSARITVRIFRENQGQRAMIFERRLEALLSSDQAYPELQDDDVVVIETVTRRGFNWRDALSIVSSVGSVVLIIDRIFFRR